MANVKFTKKEFEKQLGINLNKNEVKENISMFGTPLESVSDEEVEIEIFPNRPDLLSFPGYVRAYKAFLGKNTGLKKYEVKKSGFKMAAEKSLPKEWPYAYACIVRGLKFDDEKIKEVIDVQEKLGMTLMRNRKKGGIGVYPLEKINFPVKFVGMNPAEIRFRPLEYPSEITGRQILSKHPTGRTYAHICEKWEKLPVFIDDKGVIMSMPPIINSHEVGKIDMTTKGVFIEVTGTSQYELQKALIMLAVALADMGGRIESIECTQQDGKKQEFPDLTPEKKMMRVSNVEKILGIKLSDKEIRKSLEKMGYGIGKIIKDKKKEDFMEVLIPAWRADILHEVDLIEDVAVGWGYEKFIPEIPQISTIGEESKEAITKRKVSEALVGLNLVEVSTYHLLRKEDLKKSSRSAKIEEGFIEVESSKTDYKYLRKDLIKNALRVFSENVDSEYPQKIFEVGTVFSEDKTKNSETGIKEQEKLLVAISPGNFTEIKQVLEYLGRMFSKEFAYEELKENAETKTKNSIFIEGRCGSVLTGGHEVGIIGEVHPGILKNWHLKMPVALLEIDLGILL